jgi:hypothetical protein
VHDWLNGKRQPGRMPRPGETWDDGTPMAPWFPWFPTSVAPLVPAGSPAGIQLEPALAVP